MTDREKLARLLCKQWDDRWSLGRAIYEQLADEILDMLRANGWRPKAEDKSDDSSE